MIRFSCSACRKLLQAEDQSAGKTVTCPGCGQHLVIPPPIPNETGFSETMSDDNSEFPPQARWLGRGSSRRAKPSKYPIARSVIAGQRIFAIFIACLWPIEAIIIALATDLHPALKIGWIFALLVGHLLVIYSILLYAELLQAFLDIAKNTEEAANNTEETTEAVRALTRRRQDEIA
jgi:DNA-directed RNA polymerase subunit RPC12/RpoP